MAGGAGHADDQGRLPGRVAAPAGRDVLGCRQAVEARAAPVRPSGRCFAAGSTSTIPFTCVPGATSMPPAGSTVSAWHTTQVALVAPLASAGWPERGNAGPTAAGSPWQVPHRACVPSTWVHVGRSPRFHPGTRRGSRPSCTSATGTAATARPQRSRARRTPGPPFHSGGRRVRRAGPGGSRRRLQRRRWHPPGHGPCGPPTPGDDVLVCWPTSRGGAPVWSSVPPWQAVQLASDPGPRSRAGRASPHAAKKRTAAVATKVSPDCRTTSSPLRRARPGRPGRYRCVANTCTRLLPRSAT